MAKMSIIGEYFLFLKARKKWSLIPIAAFLLFFGALLVFAQGSPLAPFIYTLF